MEQLFVGVGQEVINPQLGAMLLGYSPMRPALSIHDDLHVTAFVFETNGEQALYLAADLCNMYYPERELREQICQAIGIPVEHTVVSCTHTHSGPDTHKESEETFFYMEQIFIPACIKAATTALNNRKRAQMGVGTTHSRVGVNRRQIKEDGKMIHGQNPHGSWDPTMTVVSFREPDGTPIGNIIQYGCHNTASGKNDEVTRDWCGVAIDRLQKVSSGVTAFINGCGGDCGPRLPNGKTTGTLQMAMELGGSAAIDAVNAYRSIKQWQDVPMKVHSGDIILPLMKVTVENTLAQAEKLGDPEKLKGIPLNCYNRLLDRAEFLRQGNIPETERVIERTVIALGPVAFMPLPFEPFSMITLRIKDHSPFPHTLCPGYSNGAMSYFPSMDQIPRGGYEVMLFCCRDFPFAEDAEQHLVAGCLKLLRELYEQ